MSTSRTHSDDEGVHGGATTGLPLGGGCAGGICVSKRAESRVPSFEMATEAMRETPGGACPDGSESLCGAACCRG